MKSVDRVLQLSLKALAVAFFSYVLYAWYTAGEINGYAALGACYSWWFSFYFSEEYKARNNPEKVLNRNGPDLVVQPAAGLLKTLKPTEIEVGRISKLTVIDNYLSLILDNNGQGYDFHIKAPKEQIVSRIRALLTEDEKKRLKLPA